MIELQTDDLRVRVDLDRGATMTSLTCTPWGELLAQRAATAPVPASASTSYGDPTLDWLSEYSGGWHVLFPNAGDACEADGVPHPFHGEVCQARWELVAQGSEHLVAQTATRLRVSLRRETSVQGRTVHVREVARNLSDRVQHVLWGHHPVFPAPPGLLIDLPGGRCHTDASYSPSFADLPPDSRGTWPLVGGKDVSRVPEGPVERYLGVSGLPAPWAAWRDVERGVGVGIAFSPEVFRHLWLWLECGGTEFPWFGGTRYLGLEPHSSWPGTGLAAAIAEQRALVLEPGAELAAEVHLTVFDADERAVQSMDAEGRVSLADQISSSTNRG